MINLKMEKRGCDFFKDDEIAKISDVGNYRVGCYNYSIHGKNGKNYIVDFCSYKEYYYSTTSKSGKPYKHPRKVLKNNNALCVRLQFENERGVWSDIPLARELQKDKSYTKADILKVINELSKKQYKGLMFH